MIEARARPPLATLSLALWVLGLLTACTVPPSDGKPATESAPITDTDTPNDTDTTPIPDDADSDGIPRWDDCDDQDASVHPGAAEVPGDGVDQDCDCQDRATIRVTDADVVWQGDVPYDHSGYRVLNVVHHGGVAVGLMMGADQVPSGKDAGFGRVAYWQPGTAVAILDGSAPKQGPFTEAMGTDGTSGVLGAAGESLLVVGRGYSDGADGTVSDPQNLNGNVDFFAIPEPGTVVPLEGVYARLTGPYGMQCGSSVAVLDLDGDGVDDVVFACFGGADRGVYAILGPIGPGIHSIEEAIWWLPETPRPDSEAGTYPGLVPLRMSTGPPTLGIEATDASLWMPTLFIATVDTFRDGTPISDIGAKIFSPEDGGLNPSSAGDPNDDGDVDFLLGIPTGADRTGTLAVLRGPVTSAVDIRHVTPSYVGTCQYDWFGFSSLVGDFNGDGVDDLAVGAPADIYYSDPRVGKVFIFDGPGWDRTSRPPEEADLVLAGDLAWDSFGANLAAGDIDHDGYDDLFVSAPLDSRDVWEAGRVYVFHGSPEGLTGAPPS